MISGPIAIKSVRFGETGFKLELGEGGKMDQDVFAGPDRMGRNVHIERHELDTYFFREKTKDGEVCKGEYELLDIVPNTYIKVAKPLDPSSLKPSALPEPAKPPAVKLGGAK